MRYASVCDGIGAVHVAWQPLGWHCEWTAEIDAFPAAVVEQRWGFPNRGDMTRFKEWDDAPIELLVGGTPCQSFSVAGLRKGLHDPRGGLMLTFLEIAQRYRPQWVVWENVPGVLSSSGGRDFGSFLGALGELGYGWAYRVLDAQWFGVAQRRRRVFVVGCLGDERRAAQVLFESESVCRDNPPSRKAGQGVAAAASSGTGSGGVPDTCGTLCAAKHPGAYSGQDAYTGRLVPQAFYSTESRCDNIPPAGLSPPLKIGSNGGGQPPAVAFSAKDYGGDASEEVSPTMRSMGHDGSHANGGGQLAVAIRTAQTSANGHGIANDVAHTLDQVQGQAVAFTKSKRAQSTTDDESWVPGEVSPTMSCFDQGDTRATTVIISQQEAGDDRARPRSSIDSDSANGIDGGCTDSGRPAPIAFRVHSNNSTAMQGNGKARVADEVEVARSLDTCGGYAASQGGNLVMQPGDTRATTVIAYDVHGVLAKKGASETDIHTALRGRTPGQSEASTTTVVAFANRTRDGIKVPEVMRDGVTPALTNPGDGGRSDAVNVVVPRPIAYTTKLHNTTSNNAGKIFEERATCLDANSPPPALLTPMAVRRLTPRECERLQGFPDDYTAIEYRKKPAADGPRYKALGNSMAVPVMAWIGQRIAAASRK